MRISLFSVFILTLFLLLACSEKTVIGEGPNAETVRDVPTFESLNVSGSYNIVVRLSEKQAIRVIAQANIIPYIVTKVRKNTLSIHPDSSVKLSYKEAPTILILTPDLNNIMLSGACHLEVSKINNKTFSINAQGRHQIILSGKTDALSIDSNGSSEIHAENLRATDTHININGSSIVLTATTDNLDGQINGYGKIGYVGTPKKITQAIHGSGTVSQIRKEDTQQQQR